ncbi:FAD-binding oxidoreductase [Tropicimonas sp. IMCC34011]|uniref:NAD(P)/FAD-dependent oxidoreductase n=1 Tax=Tropicimonas sp. IMCC34011 TaxID=2248759 RepID=UPI000E2613E5|nr:FAD-dependent oxidoreductase [Tropicimonas sp. IMCC34011]
MTVLVIGGGVVGLSVACGLLDAGEKVTVIDARDDDHRASRGNFGLIWVSGKGRTAIDYSRWTRRSAALWPDFAEELEEITGKTLGYAIEGGLDYYTDSEKLDARVAALETFRLEWDGDYPFEVLDRAALLHLEPAIGPEVVGGIFCPMDGHVNPLLLLRALSTAFVAKGGKLKSGAPAAEVSAADHRFQVTMSDGATLTAERLVLCAGLGAAKLGPMLGFRAPVRPQQGQLLITEKLPFFINHPSLSIRQVNEGGVQIGASKAEAGLDDREDTATLTAMVRDAIRIFPRLASARMVRSWAALRVMTPDGLPIYERSDAYAGASFITCHSGITLAASHAGPIADWILGKNSAPDLSTFNESRFDV